MNITLEKIWYQPTICLRDCGGKSRPGRQTPVEPWLIIFSKSYRTHLSFLPAVKSHTHDPYREFQPIPAASP
jgi:hypothetical protein